jgi:amine acid ABC transporter, permease protein, 3-TM region, His/Glu/Gln/Arg/opine family
VTAVLFDAPGPRGRRRVLVGTVAGVLVLAAVIAVAVQRLADTGQFRSVFWEPFTRSGVQQILLRGLAATLRAAGVALVLALLLGLVLAVGRLSERWLFRQVSGVTVEFFRALPLVLLIFFAFLGLPQLGIDIGGFGALVIGLTLYNGSVLAEIFRAGINAVPRGQTEAAYSLGLRKGAVTRLILIPQAVRTMLPTIISQLVVLLKDSALGFIVAYPELLRSGRRIYTNIGNVIPTAIVVGLIYVVINLALAHIATILERRQRRERRRPVEADVPVDISVGQL